MAPNPRPKYTPDAHFIARVARHKISRESARPDHELRLWVGHANTLDRLNHVILNDDEPRAYEHSNINHVQSGSPVAKPGSSIFFVNGASTWAREAKAHDGQAWTANGPFVWMSTSDDKEESSSDEPSDEDQYGLSLPLCRQSSHPPRPILRRMSDECSPAPQVMVAELEHSELICES